MLLLLQLPTTEMSEKINYSAIQVLPFGYSVSIVDGACTRDSFFMLPRSSLPPRDGGEKKNLLLFPQNPDIDMKESFVHPFVKPRWLFEYE
ncbi:hypothetical protein CEXT_446691 [Caerostris extrusa]|uniref:Uncharacterized protein n=1 Tax=Caerostris extrusa TaxID=172846 RepID=A0AAV4RE57_CAEEX|nr:hypothetical protein CEXT_446691 [Caerostris extrusa]